jgi:hypothetical protein
VRVTVLDEPVDPAPGDEDVVLRDSVAWANFPTASTLKPPNLGLVFQEPVRVPPLRWLTGMSNDIDLPFGIRSSRSAVGARIDAALLRAVDPKECSRVLIAAGAVAEPDPDGWLVEHRSRETNPAALESLLARSSGSSWGATSLA